MTIAGAIVVPEANALLTPTSYTADAGPRVQTLCSSLTIYLLPCGSLPSFCALGCFFFLGSENCILLLQFMLMMNVFVAGKLLLFPSRIKEVG